jgi:hypothetical protein
MATVATAWLLRDQTVVTCGAHGGVTGFRHAQIVHPAVDARPSGLRASCSPRHALYILHKDYAKKAATPFAMPQCAMPNFFYFIKGVKDERYLR